MGCCPSSEEDREESGETGPLLSAHRSVETHNHNVLPVTADPQAQTRADETSAINKILQETSNNLIDISAQAMEITTDEQEILLKSKQYQQRLARVTIPLPPTLNASHANPTNILSAPGIPQSDLDLITEAAEQTAHCMEKVKVHCDESLVVPFGPP